MNSTGSTLIDHTAKERAGLRGTLTRLLGGGPIPHEDVAALLLPMVRRAVRTERGPAALVSWLSRCSGPQTERVATLAEDLARLLSDPSGDPADTLDDSRA
jgi:hypothetical protein